MYERIQFVSLECCEVDIKLNFPHHSDIAANFLSNTAPKKFL